MPYKDREKYLQYLREYTRKRPRRDKQEYNRNRRLDMNKWINQQKTNPCIDCGKTYLPCVMDFDHVRGVKVKAVSTTCVKSWSKTKVIAEIAKCDLVCSNCHRVRTWKRHNEKTYSYQPRPNTWKNPIKISISKSS